MRRLTSRRLTSSFTTAIGFVIAVGYVSTTGAHGDATGIVLERHNLMTELRDANKTISAMVRGKQTLDRDELAMNAELMAELAAKMASQFPDTDASRHGARASRRDVRRIVGRV